MFTKMSRPIFACQISIELLGFIAGDTISLSIKTKHQTFIAYQLCNSINVFQKLCGTSVTVTPVSSPCIDVTGKQLYVCLFALLRVYAEILLQTFYQGMDLYGHIGVWLM